MRMERHQSALPTDLATSWGRKNLKMNMTGQSRWEMAPLQEILLEYNDFEDNYGYDMRISLRKD